MIVSTVARDVLAMIVGVTIALVLVAPVPSLAQRIKDQEAASHGFEATWHQVKDTYKYLGFKVVQFELAVLSHYSYLLVSGKGALVVDPGRDVLAYLDAAKKEGVEIKSVWLTHSHVDFIAGHIELARRLKRALEEDEHVDWVEKQIATSA